jgi:hypothetical protein
MCIYDVHFDLHFDLQAVGNIFFLDLQADLSGSGRMNGTIFVLFFSDVALFFEYLFFLDLLFYLSGSGRMNGTIFVLFFEYLFFFIFFFI